jgi:DNA invertase Pin-like site-specific DNA recombinase
MFRIAETASRQESRRIFREALAYAKRHAKRIDGLLFCKIDRASRNMADWYELEKLRTQYGVRLLFTSLEVSETPNGRFLERALAAVAAYQTEQQSVDVRDGIAKRVQDGLFPSHAPYGYRNVRGTDGRSRVEIEPDQARSIKRAFELRAYENLTVEQICRKLHDEGMVYCDSKHRFPKSKMHDMLQDRSYIGEVFFHDEWHRGTHSPIVDLQTWNTVQASIGNRQQRSHKLLFSNSLVRCGHCFRPITGEKKTKKTSEGLKNYVYYRCARYLAPQHPRVRIPENALEMQAKQLFAALTLPTPAWKTWATNVAITYLRFRSGESKTQQKETLRQVSLIRSRMDELLNLRLTGQIDDQTFDLKKSELKEQESLLAKRAKALKEHSKQIEQKAQTAAFLFDTIRQKWGDWDVDTKHLVLRLVFGSFKLDGKKLVQGDRTPIELFRQSSV